MALLALSGLGGCRGRDATLAPTRYGSTGLGENLLRGDLVPVHDPSLIREGRTYYAFTTDLPFTHATTYLPIRCSPDARVWRGCGHVFDAMPAWVRQRVPGVVGLWAPEVSYYGGVYHLYYGASRLGSHDSVIGLETNGTLDPEAPGYRWVDQGEVLGSRAGDDFNAIDPAVLVDHDGAAWLSYGSFWSGIKQRRLDPGTGKLSAQDTRVYALAARPRDPTHAIEGASLVAHGGYYYLFASVGICCEIPIERDTYREIVGRSRSVHGPFVGEDGSKMLRGGGTVLLASNALWLAPGGASAYTDPQSGETLLCFHALRRSENGALYLWVKRVEWKDGWPVLRDR
ncbi:MAG TPA: arabinan endo-1,5-alpha-L-arabinosidase [Acidobacteriaceae bacterium]